MKGFAPRRKSQSAQDGVADSAPPQPSAAATTSWDPFANEAAELLLRPFPAMEANFEILTVEGDDRDTPALTGVASEPRPVGKRGAGRHAAPSSGLGSLLTGKRASR